MNIFFPQVNAALVVRKHCPKGGRLVTTFADKGVYLIDAETCPRGAEIAEGPLGGWNYEECVGLVYASRLADLSRYRREVAGDWVVFPRQLANGRWCGLLKTPTPIPFGIGCTPVVIK